MDPREEANWWAWLSLAVVSGIVSAVLMMLWKWGM